MNAQLTSGPWSSSLYLIFNFTPYASSEVGGTVPMSRRGDEVLRGYQPCPRSQSKWNVTPRFFPPRHDKISVSMEEGVP